MGEKPLNQTSPFAPRRPFKTTRPIFFSSGPLNSEGEKRHQKKERYSIILKFGGIKILIGVREEKESKEKKEKKRNNKLIRLKRLNNNLLESLSCDLVSPKGGFAISFEASFDQLS